KHLKILIPSIIAGLLVAFLGWQGGQVVESELAPLVVTMHLLVSLGLLSLLTYVTQQSYYISNPEADRGGHYPRGGTALVGTLWLLVIVQVLLGGHVRGALEKLTLAYPLSGDLELLGKVGVMIWIHPILGGIVALFTWIVGLRLLSGGEPVGLVKQGVWWIMLLVAGQLMLGLGLISIGTPPLLQVFHLWLAALLIGALLSIYTALKRGGPVTS
ncbi:MAG: COX15/CtaA family protein, partial [bacterium]